MADIRQKIRSSSVNRALNILGDVWTLNILRDAFLGVRLFSEFLGRMPIPRQTLTNRLRALVEQNLLETHPYQKRPIRLEYRLTKMGLELYPFMLMVWRWQRRWGRYNSMLPSILIHKTCSNQTQPIFSCGHCSEEVQIRDVYFEDGPGAGFDTPSAPRIKRLSTRVGDDPADQEKWASFAANLISDRWSQLIINAVFLGCRTYDGMQRDLLIGSSVLAHRLKVLVESEFLRKVSVESDTRRSEYLLTDKSRYMFPITVTLLRWGDKWLAGPKGPPLIRYHRPCGHRLDAKVKCSSCGAELHPWDVTFHGAAGQRAGRVEHAKS